MLLLEIEGMIANEVFPMKKLIPMHLLVHPYNKIKQYAPTLPPDPVHILQLKSK